MFRSPDVYGYFTSSFTPVKRLTASLTGTYTGSMLVQHLAGYIPEDREEKTKDFFDLNVKVAYDFPLYKSVTLQVDVYKRQGIDLMAFCFSLSKIESEKSGIKVIVKFRGP